jgi:elongation factor 1-gamma
MPSTSGVSGTLFTYPGNPRAHLIQIAAQYGGSTIAIDEKFTFGTTEKTPEFTKKFPFGVVPAFECAQGCLNETMAIASFVGSAILRGEDEFSRAQVTQWMNLAETQVFPAACKILYPCWGLMPNNKAVVGKGHEAINAIMQSLDQYLEPRTYLVGERVTLADISLAIYMRDLFSMIFDETVRNKYLNVTRWFTTIVNQDEFLRITGETALCVKPAQFDSKLFAQNNPKPAKKEAPKKEAPKPREEKKEAPPPPAKKVPFSHLAPTKLDLDEWKRTYKNKTLEEQKAFFKEFYVPGEWSAWLLEFNGKPFVQDYRANNLIRGVMQRMDALKRYAFGIFKLFVQGPKFQLIGLFFGRGDKNIFLESEDFQQDIDCFDVSEVKLTEADGEKFFWDIIGNTITDIKGFENDPEGHVFMI